MILHKVLLGERAGVYLPFALSRLRALEAQDPNGIFEQTFIPEPGITVQVRQMPPFQYINIDATGESYFEFHSTGFPVVTEEGSQGAITFTQYDGVVVGTPLRGDGAGGLSLAPVIRGGKRSTDSGLTESKVGRQSQVQLINEPAMYPFPVGRGTGRRYPLNLYQSWAPGHAHTGPIGFRAATMQAGYRFMEDPGHWDAYAIRDIGYDVPFELGEKAQRDRRAYVQGDTDWPRASGMQKVSSALWGKRTFALMIDASGNFAVFPLASIGDRDGIEQNVDENAVQRLPVPLPEWAFTTNGRFKDSSDTVADTVDKPELQWQFNHLGTKAVAIVYQRKPYEYDDAYWAEHASDTPLSVNVFNWIVRGMGYQARHSAFFQDGYNPQTYFFAPGIVEVDVDIELTGPNPRDFSASVHLREIRTPESMTRWAIAVGYNWFDVLDDDGTVRVAAGDMVAIDIERWGGSNSGGVIAYSFALLYSVRKVATDEELYCGPIGRSQPLHAIDLRTLSWVQRRWTVIENETEYPFAYRDSGTTSTMTHFHDDFALAVFVKLKFKDLLTRETPYPEGAIDDLRTRLETQDMRAIINAARDTTLGWSLPLQYVTPNTPYDGGWSDPAMEWIRHKWAFHTYGEALSPQPSIPFLYYDPDDGDPLAEADRRYNTAPSNNFKDVPPEDVGLTEPVDSNERIEQIYSLWHGSHDQILGLTSYIPDNLHLLICPAPKWGWNAYMSTVQDITYFSPYLTFYAHPSGTWALWWNGCIYNGEGWPEQGEYSDGFDANTNTLDDFVGDQFEHIIFDRIHFEIGTAIKDTTFLELHNTAVGKLEDTDLRAMTLADLRATFSKGTIVDEDTAASVLEIVMDWQGTRWYRPERLYNQAPSGVIAGPPYGLARFLNLHQLWFTEPGYSGDVRTPISAVLHPRFANPTLLMP